MSRIGPEEGKEIEEKIIKNKRKLFKLEKENKAIRTKIFRDTRNLFEQKYKYHYKPAGTGNLWHMENSINNIMSSKDNDEEREMHSKSGNIEIMINDKAGEVKEKLFQSLRSRYQIGLETTMKGSDLLYEKCHKINPNRGRSYIDNPN